MTLRLNGSSSGYVEIDAPATAGSNTLVLPTGNGTNGQVLSTNGSGALSWATATEITAGTAVATTSGSAIELTGIPSTAKRVMLTFRNVSLSGVNELIFRIGDSGGIETTGYVSTTARLYGGFSAGSNAYEQTAGWYINWGDAGAVHTGHLMLTNTSGNYWVATIQDHIDDPNYYVVMWAGGYKELSGTLTQVGIATSGANTFDSGEIRLFYEV